MSEFQTRDDVRPELPETFTVEITSATGGATINPNARTAKIVVVASDYPHGLFEFSQPTELTVTEGDHHVSEREREREREKRGREGERERGREGERERGREGERERERRDTE